MYLSLSLSGTRYPVINRKVEKFINKHQIFPDYPDIFSIICYCNKKHNLRLRKKMLQELAKDVFTEVGNRLQERRMEDFISNFGSHLTDRYKYVNSSPILL
ncbi:hypothetical protein LSH36_383g01025 [Paralvinella palmiformis]|uniref:Daxx histone-binding domain-containing protein n=1 Tax=Paralvinella palmiformis TaxID=53620 RepID=A0AAD9JDE8_9ANNE|nr:hypothetical protein LSH36_383g01025 [Paralvinella palmiformis]